MSSVKLYNIFVIWNIILLLVFEIVYFSVLISFRKYNFIRRSEDPEFNFNLAHSSEYFKKIFNAIFAAVEGIENANNQVELETVLSVDRALIEYQYTSSVTAENYKRNIKSGHEKWQKSWKEYVSTNEEALKRHKLEAQKTKAAAQAIIASKK